MGGGGVVGLWVNDIFGIERGRLYGLFDLERFNLFVSLVRLGLYHLYEYCGVIGDISRYRSQYFCSK